MSGTYENQRQQILTLLASAHSGHSWTGCTNDQCGWVPLPQILSLGIAMYQTRIFELRHKAGLNVENKMNGPSKSWFRLGPGQWKKPPKRVDARARRDIARAIELDDASEERKQPEQAVMFLGNVSRFSYPD